MIYRGGAYFISGVDTDSGKTYVTARMASYLHHRGVSVITQKPVQTGCRSNIADDLIEHRKVMGCGALPEDREGRTCTYIFKAPFAPQYAAQLEGVQIDLDNIDRDIRYLLSRYRVVLVEGIGGLMVPLNDESMVIDYIASRKMPLILITTSKVGGINHALLSIEACKNRDIDLHTVVYNRMPGDDKAMADDTLSVIEKFAKTLYPHVQVIDFRSSDSFWDKEL
ncbi:MAG: ATP-dependent dethiobiotin synthetase BioD [Bacteroidales bacterium]|nr:ATP-dependent dethiobiotin synthetase BioD [Bacteroidales bacterium]